MIRFEAPANAETEAHNILIVEYCQFLVRREDKRLKGESWKIGCLCTCFVGAFHRP